MRTLVKITIPVDPGNDAIKSGTLPNILTRALEELKPEAAYFLAENGVRTAMLVIDLKEPSDIPAIAERFFQGFSAAVSFTPVMNADDLEKGLSKIST